jgi:hypothetical protein
MLAKTPEGDACTCEKELLCQVTVRIDLCAIDALEIFALNQRFDTLLDHVDFGLELSGQLTKGLGDELLM